MGCSIFILIHPNIIIQLNLILREIRLVCRFVTYFNYIISSYQNTASLIKIFYLTI